jgi:hypothetical protein
MKYRIIAAVALGFLVLNLGGSTFADSKSKKASMNQLVSLLPVSDGVMTLDAKRFFGEALVGLLSGNQPMLVKANGHIEEFRTKTGIDIRQFDEVAVGVTARQIAGKEYDVDPVVIARGQMTAASLITAAKTASGDKYREERIGDRVLYVFEAGKLTATAASASSMVGGITEVGIAAMDERIVAFGEVGRVRLTLEGKTKVGSDLTGMLERSPTSVAAFAIKPPAGLKAFVPLDNDELGKDIDSIQYLYGNANVLADRASVHVTARTLQNTQASSLYETLEGLQMVGKAFLGGSKAADKQVYSRLISNAKFSVKANEVKFDLTVPQSDIDVLVGLLK